MSANAVDTLVTVAVTIGYYLEWAAVARTGRLGAELRGERRPRNQAPSLGPKRRACVVGVVIPDAASGVD